MLELSAARRMHVELKAETDRKSGRTDRDRDRSPRLDRDQFPKGSASTRSPTIGMLGQALRNSSVFSFLNKLNTHTRSS
jgi:hypothetical protein